MEENGRAWFYLTLWHGTPPEFTTEIGVNIARVDSVSASIHTADAVESGIRTADSFETEISTQETAGADIITVTEVVWRVH